MLATELLLLLRGRRGSGHDSRASSYFTVNESSDGLRGGELTGVIRRR